MGNGQSLSVQIIHIGLKWCLSHSPAWWQEPWPSRVPLRDTNHVIMEQFWKILVFPNPLFHCEAISLRVLTHGNNGRNALPSLGAFATKVTVEHVGLSAPRKLSMTGTALPVAMLPPFSRLGTL